MEITKTTKLYNGKIIIDFYEAKHWYCKRGEKGTIISVTGATSMLDKSAVLMNWAVNMAKDYLTTTKLQELQETNDADKIIGIVDEAIKVYREKKEEAAGIGKEIHSWVERYIKSNAGDRQKMISTKDFKKLDEKIINGITAFLRWTNQYKVKFIESEKLVYSKKYDYVGLMDLKAKINGKLAAVDFKTSNGIYNEMRYQLSAYRAADEEESGDQYDESWIIKFGKDDGEFGAYKINNHKEDFKAFLGLLAVKKREKELSKKENWLVPEEI